MAQHIRASHSGMSEALLAFQDACKVLSQENKMPEFDYGKIQPDGQHENYPSRQVSNDDFIRPYRTRYKHWCGIITTAPEKIARTLAADPKFYDRMFCAGCRGYFTTNEFHWVDNAGKETEGLGS